MADIWEDIRGKSFLPISRRNYLLVSMRGWGYKAQGMCLYKQFPSENKLSLIQQTIYRRLIGTILVALLVHDESLAQPISAWILQIVRLLDVKEGAGASVIVLCAVRGHSLRKYPFHMTYVESRR